MRMEEAPMLEGRIDLGTHEVANQPPLAGDRDHWQDDPLLRDGDRYGNFRSAGFSRALGYYANMFEQGWAPRMSETEISNVWDEFFNGFYAFYLSGPWNIREFRRRQPPGLEGKWSTMPLPVKSTSSSRSRSAVSPAILWTA